MTSRLRRSRKSLIDVRGQVGNEQHRIAGRVPDVDVDHCSIVVLTDASGSGRAAGSPTGSS